MDIHVLHHQGQSIRQKAKQLNLSCNTIRRNLRNIAQTPHYGPRPERGFKLDPF